MGMACEHYVVLNKRDLMPAWGVEVQSLAQYFVALQSYITLVAAASGCEEVSAI